MTRRSSDLDLTPTPRRVLVVDDEANIRDVLCRYLAADGFLTTQATDGEEALRQVVAKPPDMIILDLLLPGLDGLEVCRRTRATSAVPILLLTAKGEEPDNVVGFSVGADDYVTKPFSVKVLLQRIRALQRRTDSGSEPVG